MTALQMWNYAGDLMAVCQDALDTLPDEDPDLRGCPERTYFADGAPSYDCPDQLTVHLAVMGEAPPAIEGALGTMMRVRFGRVNVPALVVTIVRCRPKSLSERNAPPVADLDAAAKQHMADAWVIWNAVYRKVAAGQLFVKCDGLETSLAVADDPSGMVSGWTFTFAPSTDGYDPLPDWPGS